VGGLLAELGRKLADRWLTLLVIPGALYLATAAAARTLGHAHSFDIDRLTAQVTAWTRSGTVHSTSGLAVILIAALLACAGAGIAAQAAGSAIERVLLAEHHRRWPFPFRQLAQWRVGRRVDCWSKATASYRQKLDAQLVAKSRNLSPASADGDETSLSESRGNATRIAYERPARPTWIGDRVNAVTVQMDQEYLVDLPTVWPHLWLTMPETTRTEITTARDALTGATSLIGWGVLYLLLTILWWPALAISAATIWTGWRRARAATERYAQLLEAATRVHAPDLARTVGLPCTGPLDRDIGWQLTLVLQGQQHLISLTSPPADSSAAELRELRGINAASLLPDVRS
jgi:hypothetical protein